MIARRADQKSAPGKKSMGGFSARPAPVNIDNG
jgi:hypothetical protein